VKIKNPNAPAVKREVEEDWGRQWHAAVSNRRRSAAALIVYFVVPRVPH